MKLQLDKLNIADWLSVSRLALIPVLLIFVFLDKKVIVGWVVLIGFLTDALDGFIARRLGIASKRGARLDSMADLLFLVSSLTGFSWAFADFVLANLWVLVTAIGLFSAQFAASRVRYGKASSFHTYLAKATAVALASLLVSSFFIGPVNWLYYLAFSLGILEAIEEIALVLMLPEPKTNVKGLYWALKDKEAGR